MLEGHLHFTKIGKLLLCRIPEYAHDLWCFKDFLLRNGIFVRPVLPEHPEFAADLVGKVDAGGFGHHLLHGQSRLRIRLNSIRFNSPFVHPIDVRKAKTYLHNIDA